MFVAHLICLFLSVFFSLIKCNCDSEIYCRGPILEKIQMSGLFADSKQFVDMPTSKSKAVVKLKKDNISISNYYFPGSKKLCSSS